MRIGVYFLYIALTIIYLIFGDSSVLWGGVNIVSHIGFIGFLCHILSGVKKFSENERLFFSYLKWLSLANCIYIATCIVKDKTFAWHNTDIFAYVMGLGFVVFLVHCSQTKS